ncbi:MAG TPA: hypothetical protein PKK26_07035 [Candidatus Wallbacteria bacterium]|nr:hypothetical protein [Candidatus Wallbacteria bacterium]
MADIAENFLKAHKEKVDEMQKKTVELKRTFDDSKKEYESKLDDMLSVEKSKGRAKEGKKFNVGELKALDSAIVQGKEYQQDMQSLIEELTNELENLGRKVATTKDYQGLEKFWGAIGATKWANASRLDRIKTQNVDGSMKTVLAYANGTVESLNQQIAKNAEMYSALTQKEKIIVEKLNENQPKYEHWREEVRRLGKEIEDVDRRLREANETERPKVEQEKTTLSRELDQAKLNETSYFEIVKNASEAVSLVRHHAQGFYQAIDALTQSKIKTAEKIDNLKEIFTGIYQIMETALEIKGFSRIDSTLNYLADKTTETLNTQLEGILDETMARNEKKVIDDDKMVKYMEHLGKVVENFTDGMKKQQDKYSKKE